MNAPHGEAPKYRRGQPLHWFLLSAEVSFHDEERPNTWCNMIWRGPDADRVCEVFKADWLAGAKQRIAAGDATPTEVKSVAIRRCALLDGPPPGFNEDGTIAPFDPFGGPPPDEPEPSWK